MKFEDYKTRKERREALLSRGYMDLMQFGGFIEKATRNSLGNYVSMKSKTFITAVGGMNEHFVEIANEVEAVEENIKEYMILLVDDSIEDQMGKAGSLQEALDFEEWLLYQTARQMEKATRKGTSKFWRKMNFSHSIKEKLEELTEFEAFILGESLGIYDLHPINLQGLSYELESKQRWILAVYKHIFYYTLVNKKWDFERDSIFKECYKNLETWRIKDE